MTIQEIGQAIKSHPDEVLALWREITSKEPWLQQPESADLNHVPAMLLALVDTALLEPESFEKRLSLVNNAAEHGQQRREQCFPESVLLLEHHVLRRALGGHITRTAGGALVAFEAITRVELTVTLGSTASVRGYHRPELEEKGEWPQAVEQLAREWLPPWDLSESPRRGGS